MNVAMGSRGHASTECHPHSPGENHATGQLYICEHDTRAVTSVHDPGYLPEQANGASALLGRPAATCLPEEIWPEGGHGWV